VEACPAMDQRRRLDLAPDVALLGFLGRFMEQKGFLPLMCALARLLRAGPPRPFHLAAVGSGDRAQGYGQRIRDLGLERHVSMVPFVPDVLPVLRQLDLLVVPSLWEASSLFS